MRAPLAFIVLSVAGGAAWAQPLNDAVNGLESCFIQARIADSICSKGVLNTDQQQDCFQKVRYAQLRCLEHVQQEMPAGSKPPQQPSAAGWPQSPATIRSRAPSGAGSPAIGVAPGSPPRTPTEQPDSATGVTVPARPQVSDWVVSETTSASDHLAMATIHSTFSTKSAPDRMVIRCRGSQTELLLRTKGTWRRSRSGEVQVEYRIDTHPPIVSRWA